MKYALSDDISSIRGIGSKRKEQLSAAGIETIGDLLSYYPVKYKDRRHLVRAMDAGTDKDSLTCGRLIKVQLRPLYSSGILLTISYDYITTYYYIFKEKKKASSTKCSRPSS